ncbi:MAG: NifU family protein [Rhodothalassiaceae bacterium]
MFIQVEPTPNPATLKFLPGDTVMERGTANFPSADVAEASPLAKALFDHGGVENVFYGWNFVSVTKADAADWDALKPAVLNILMQHFSTDQPLFVSSAPQQPETEAMQDDPADSEIIATIKDLLDQRVRPAVAQDGGDIVYHGFQNGVVYLNMQGACSGCPMSTATLKNGIENLLRYYVPEVTEVRAVN